jgi:hypothetical protein
LKLSRQSDQQNDSSTLNLKAAAKRLKVSDTVVRRLIQLKVLPATQVVVGAPWQIARNDADSPMVVRAAQRLQRREGSPELWLQQECPRLPGFEECNESTIV